MALLSWRSSGSGEVASACAIRAHASPALRWLGDIFGAGRLAAEIERGSLRLPRDQARCSRCREPGTACDVASASMPQSRSRCAKVSLDAALLRSGLGVVAEREDLFPWIGSLALADITAPLLLHTHARLVGRAGRVAAGDVGQEQGEPTGTEGLDSAVVPLFVPLSACAVVKPSEAAVASEPS